MTYKICPPVKKNCKNYNIKVYIDRNYFIIENININCTTIVVKEVLEKVKEKK